MINKIFKPINNKFSRFFKFLFFLRYLFLIFFVAITLFLSIPHFFDYKKKEELIKNYLYQNYNLEIKKIESIKYHSFTYNLSLVLAKACNFKNQVLSTNTEIKPPINKQ